MSRHLTLAAGRHSGHLYFLPSCCGSRPSLTEACKSTLPTLHQSVGTCGSLPPPPTDGCMPTLPSHGARRRKGCSTTVEKSLDSSRACIPAPIGGLNWARLVPLPLIFPELQQCTAVCKHLERQQACTAALTPLTSSSHLCHQRWPSIRHQTPSPFAQCTGNASLSFSPTVGFDGYLTSGPELRAPVDGQSVQTRRDRSHTQSYLATHPTISPSYYISSPHPIPLSCLPTLSIHPTMFCPGGAASAAAKIRR